MNSLPAKLRIMAATLIAIAVLVSVFSGTTAALFSDEQTVTARGDAGFAAVSIGSNLAVYDDGVCLVNPAVDSIAPGRTVTATCVVRNDGSVPIDIGWSGAPTSRSVTGRDGNVLPARPVGVIGVNDFTLAPGQLGTAVIYIRLSDSLADYDTNGNGKTTQGEINSYQGATFSVALAVHADQT